MTTTPRANLWRGGAIGLCAKLGAVLSAVLGAAPMAQGQGAFRDASIARRATVIDDRLESMLVDVISLDEQALVYVTKYGRRREMARSQVLAIIPEHTIRLSPARGRSSTGDGLLMLNDGRRLSGELELQADVGDDASESLAWEHQEFGPMRFDLSIVSWFVQDESAIDLPWDRSSPPTVDQLILFNGDRLTGFLASAGSTFVIEDSGNEIRVDQARVSAARLANPTADPSGVRLWMSDGSVVGLRSYEIGEAGSVLYTLEDGQSLTDDWSLHNGVLLDAGRLMPLTSLQPVSESPVGERRFSEPSRRVARAHGGAALTTDRLGMHFTPALDVYDLLIPGPMELEYELPEGATRLGCTASLDVGTSPWGDCHLRVAVDGVEVFSQRLATSDPEAEFVIDTPGRMLTIAIDPGHYGPINDRVVLRRAMLLVDEPVGVSPGLPGR